MCPFCFALQVEILYENVLRALERQAGPLELFLHVKTEYVAADKLNEALAEAKEWAQTLDCRRYFRGHITRVTVAPTHGHEDTYSLRQASLLALDSGAGPPFGGRIVRVKGRSPFTLARVAARLGRYPVGLLYEDARRVVPLLDILAGRHLGSTTGVFRFAGSVATIDQCRSQKIAQKAKATLEPHHLAEETRIVAGMESDSPLHLKFIVRSLLEKVGLQKRPNAMPIKLFWGGTITVTIEDLYKQTIIKELCSPHVHEDEFAVVIGMFGDYWVISTVPPDNHIPSVNAIVALEFRLRPRKGRASTNRKQCFTFEPLSLLADRLIDVFRLHKQPKEALRIFKEQCVQKLAAARARKLALETQRLIARVGDGDAAKTEDYE